MPAPGTKTRKVPAKKAARKPARSAKVPAKRKTTRRRAKPTGPGAPTILTPETTRAIVDRVAIGNYFETAVRSAGLSPSTAYGWMARARKEVERRHVLDQEHVEPGTGDEEAETIVRELDVETFDREQRFVEFMEAVQKAEADAEAFAVGTLRTLMGKEHDGQVRARAALNYLERKHPRRWSRAERSEVMVDSTSRVEVVLPSQEEVRARALETFDVLREVGIPELVERIASGEDFDEDED